MRRQLSVVRRLGGVAAVLWSVSSASCNRVDGLGNNPQGMPTPPLSARNRLPDTVLRKNGGWTAQDVVDFGSVTRGTRWVQGVWRLGNPHQQPRRILDVSKPCACHRVLLRRGGTGSGNSREKELDAWQVPFDLGPAEEIDLVIEVDARHIGREIAGRLRVTTDDPEQPVVGVNLRGSVREIFSVVPEMRDLGLMPRGLALAGHAEFEVRRLDGSRFRIRDLLRCPPGFFAWYHAIDYEQTSWRLLVSVYGVTAEGPFRESVDFVADDGSIGRCQLSGEVPWRITTEPRGAIHLGVLGPGGIATGLIKLRSSAVSSWADLRADWEWEGERPQGVSCDLRIEAQVVEQAEVVVIWRTGVAGEVQAGPMHGRVLLRLMDGSFRREIHAYGYLRTDQ
jgi:hypothetical protein